MRFCRPARTGLALVLLQLAIASAASAQVQQILSAAPGPARAGETVHVQVLWLNSGNAAARLSVPGRIACTLTAGARRMDAELLLSDPEKALETEILPGKFFKAAYRLHIPPNLEHDVVVRIDGTGAVSIAVTESAPSPSAVASGTARRRGGEEPFSGAFFAKNLYGYDPIYFLYGAEPRDAKFQLSLKYRIFGEEGPLASRWSAFKRLFFGYTQTSLWDLDAASKPFEDTSYKPEIFYLSRDVAAGPLPGADRVDFQTGIQHESNGRGGEASRSLNIAYVRPTLIFGDPQKYHLTVSPKLWTYIGDLSDNPDIYRYRGYFDLHVDYGSFDGWKIASLFRKGTEGARGSLQLDLTYPLNLTFVETPDFFLHAQFFSGDGESLLHYNRYDTRFRLGLSLYR